MASPSTHWPTGCNPSPFVERRTSCSFRIAPFPQKWSTVHSELTSSIMSDSAVFPVSQRLGNTIDRNKHNDSILTYHMPFISTSIRERKQSHLTTTLLIGCIGLFTHIHPLVPLPLIPEVLEFVLESLGLLGHHFTEGRLIAPLILSSSIHRVHRIGITVGRRSVVESC